MEPHPFQRFHPDAVLGQGSLGVTWRGHDPVLDLPVALKVLRPEKIEDSTIRERLHRACSAWQGLQHPGVVRLHRLEESGAHAALVLELVQGATLTRLLFDQRLRAGNAASWQISLLLLEVFHHASARQVAHGSLSPADIFLERSPGGSLRLKVSDFGLAAALAGRRPRLEDDMPAVANVVALLLTGQPIVHGTASGPAGELLARAADTRPAARFPSFRDFYNELSACSPLPQRGQRLPSVPPPTIGSQPTLPVESREMPVAVAAAASPPFAGSPPPGGKEESTAFLPRLSTPAPAAAPAPASAPLPPAEPAVTATPAPAAAPAPASAPASAPAAAPALAAASPPPAKPTVTATPAPAAAPAPASAPLPEATTRLRGTPFPAAGEPGDDDDAGSMAAAAPVARPSRARQGRMASATDEAAAAIPESLKLALQKEERVSSISLGRPEGQEDPFVTATPAPTAERPADWVEGALAKPGRAQRTGRSRPAGQPDAQPASPEQHVARTPARRGSPPRVISLLLVANALLLILAVGALLAWLLRHPEEGLQEMRPEEETEEAALQRVMGIGTVPAREKGKAPTGLVRVPEQAVAPPVDQAPVVPAAPPPPGSQGPTTIPPNLVAGMPSGPAVVRLPEGPEIPTSPLVPQVGTSVSGSPLPVIPFTPEGSFQPSGPAPAGSPAPAGLPAGLAAAAGPLPSPGAGGEPRLAGGTSGIAAGGFPPTAAPQHHLVPAPQPYPSPAGAGPGDREASMRYNALGLAQYKQGNHDRALELYLEAVAADPSYHWPYYNAACMYALQGDARGAIRYLEGYLRTSPKKIDIYGMVYKDSDFNPIMHDPGFRDWLDRHNE